MIHRKNEDVPGFPRIFVKSYTKLFIFMSLIVKTLLLSGIVNTKKGKNKK